MSNQELGNDDFHSFDGNSSVTPHMILDGRVKCLVFVVRYELIRQIKSQHFLISKFKF